jgi:hypothetical protein
MSLLMIEYGLTYGVIARSSADGLSNIVTGERWFEIFIEPSFLLDPYLS